MRATKGLLKAASGPDAVLFASGGSTAKVAGWAIEYLGWCGELPLLT